MLLFIFFTLIRTEFVLMATEIDFSPFNEVFCDNDDCAEYICRFLANTSSCISYVIMMPMNNNTACPVTKYRNTTRMVTFVINEKTDITQSLVCNTINNCLTQGCQLFKNTPNPFMLVFTGQCI